MTEPDENPTASPDDATSTTDRTLASPKTTGLEDKPVLYTDLVAPSAMPTEPPPPARWLAFGSILVGGLLGGLIGYGTGDLMTGSPIWAALGGLIGAALCAVGVGIVAGLALRAMNEWKPVKHPESETRAASGLVLRTTDDRQSAADVDE